MKANNGSAKAAAEGKHWAKGKKWTPEQREKLKNRKTRKGIKSTPEARSKLSATRKAMFASGFKMDYSAETRRKISEGRKRYWANLPTDKMEAVKERGRQRMRDPAFASKFRHSKNGVQDPKQQEFKL